MVNKTPKGIHFTMGLWIFWKKGGPSYIYFLCLRDTSPHCSNSISLPLLGKFPHFYIFNLATTYINIAKKKNAVFWTPSLPSRPHLIHSHPHLHLIYSYPHHTFIHTPNKLRSPWETRQTLLHTHTSIMHHHASPCINQSYILFFFIFHTLPIIEIKSTT